MVLAPNIGLIASPYPTLHKYAHSTSVNPCVSVRNVCSASAKYWSLHLQIQHSTNTPTAHKKLHVFPLGMGVGLIPIIANALAQQYLTLNKYAHNTSETSCVSTPNIGLSITMSNTTQIRPQHFRNFMCVHWECVLC